MVPIQNPSSQFQSLVTVLERNTNTYHSLKGNSVAELMEKTEGASCEVRIYPAVEVRSNTDLNVVMPDGGSFQSLTGMKTPDAAKRIFWEPPLNTMLPWPQPCSQKWSHATQRRQCSWRR